MSINRRQFLRRSLAGSAAVVVGKELGAATPAAVGTLPLQAEDASPPSKGKSVLGLQMQTFKNCPHRVVGLGRGAGAVKRLAQIDGTEIGRHLRPEP